jgi:hypothetical protein
VNIGQLILAKLSHEYAPLDNTFAPMEYIEGVPDPNVPPTYPEVNPTYPGPFLRDPGELDPWEDRDIG